MYISRNRLKAIKRGYFIFYSRRIEGNKVGELCLDFGMSWNDYICTLALAKSQIETL